ncbi:aldo/keto reductase [Spirosoma aureum]|uniref:Aldo/keto reductase n=1 Tax=Spirosoma aureum TaxID=2692134 RepID=A0A6G9AHF3_9BACT|nr:aldo/keto reductase [Spirosoma aureum]QIP11868.1 aldo/keto reductase [Spirosoma aureum]
MNHRSIRNSDLVVSEIAYGCMSLGSNYTDNAHLIHRALDTGITLFDTADLYDHGQNELMVGKALAGMRQQVVLATKVGNQWRPDGSGWDWNPTKAYILQAVDESLRRLQTDYIDLYQLHGGTLDDPIDETIEAFELLKNQGKIREYGISSIRPAVIREWITRSNMVSVMMQYSLLDRRPEEACLDLLHEHQISVLARGSLAKGLLINKPAVPYLNYTTNEVQQATESIAAVSNAERNPVATAIHYALHHPVVASAVVGIRTMEQLTECMQTEESPALTESEWNQLASTLPANQYDQHR